MVDVIFQQQVQLRQQRQAVEEQRRRLMSQQSLRQVQDRNIALQRQQQLKELSQTEQQISSQDLQLQQLQQQQQSQQVDNREAQRQEALRILVQKGKGSSALYSLPKEERAAIEAYASELKASRERGAGIGAVGQAERTLSASLTPELRRQIYLQGAELPRVDLPNLSSKFEQLTQPQFTPAPPTIFQSRPLVVTPAKTFTQQVKDIIFAPVEKTKSGAYNIPGQVRKIAPLTSLAFSTGVAKVEQKLKEFGIGEDSPIFKQTSIPVSRIVGDVALGSLLVGLSGTSGQVAVSRYIKDGRIYYLDNTGQVIGSESVEQAGKNIADFRQALIESSVFKKAGSRYYNEPNLRERTRELINKASPKQLESLRNLYKQSGRLDLFNDILAQERDIVARTNTISKSVPKPVKDIPSQLTGAGQVTSQFAGTGQYERTDMVAGGIPQQRGNQITNIMLLSNNNAGLRQSGFNISRLAQTSILGLSTKTKQTTQQINQLGLRTETQTKQGSRQARALLNFFRTAQQTRQQSRQLSQLKSQLEFGKPRGRYRPPKPKIPLPFKLPQESTSISKVGTEDSFGVGIEVRRKGKFQVLGTETTLESALRKASNIVDIGLARSFRLRSRETGQLLDISQLPIGFRRAKREARTFVEQSSRALSQFGEKKEIQYFKKTKTRRLL